MLASGKPLRSLPISRWLTPLRSRTTLATRSPILDPAIALGTPPVGPTGRRLRAPKVPPIPTGAQLIPGAAIHFEWTAAGELSPLSPAKFEVAGFRHESPNRLETPSMSCRLESYRA